MSGSTTNYAIPYPTGGDTVGASIVQQLAERVEYLFTGWWGPVPQYVAKAGDTMTGTLTRSGAANGFVAFLNAAATIAYAAQVSGESFFRFIAQVDGKLGWGPGTATRDWFLERVGTGVGRITGALQLTSYFQQSATTYGNGAQTLSLGTYLAVFTGSIAPTWTLPAVGTFQQGIEIQIKNRGSATITVQRAGSDQLYTTAAVTSITVAAGASARLINDGTYWLVL